jgi:hypothetical protein
MMDKKAKNPSQRAFGFSKYRRIRGQTTMRIPMLWLPAKLTVVR